MATTYTASFEFECWKQHTCVGCGETFRYRLKRKVQGQAGTEQGAFVAAQNAAVKAMENDVDVHPCPGCGAVQPDMVAAVQRPWYWAAMLIGIGGVMVAFFPVLAHGWSIETSAWIAAVPMGLALLLAFIGSMRNPNANPTANLNRVSERIDAGTLRVVPKTEDDVDSAADDFEDEVPRSFSSSNTVALGMFLVGLVAVVAAPLVQRMSGWPTNDRWYPAVIGPGDQSTFYYKEKLSSMKGYWHAVELPDGTKACRAIVENGGDLGLDEEQAILDAKTKESTWGLSISTKSKSDPSNRMWAKVAFPDLEELVDAEASLTVLAGVEYPETINDEQGQVSQRLFVESEVPVNLASAGAGGNYHQIWMMGQIAAMGLCLMGGISLLRAASGLVNAAHPTSVFPLEEPEIPEDDASTDPVDPSTLTDDLDA